MGAHAGEEEATQEWIDADLAGTRDFREKANDAGAELAQIARELIGAGEVLKFAAAGENVETKLRECVEKLVEARTDLGGSLFGIEAGAC